MTYREMMNLYKEGKLEGGKKLKIEADIEQHEAISDYLYENENMPSVAEILLDESKVNEDDGKTESIAKKRAAAEKKAEQDAQDFTKRVKKSIRRMMIRMGVVVGVIVLAVVLTVMFVIPKAADSFYYDPMNANGSTFEKDMAVYSRMFAPDVNWYNLFINRNGYGEYDINVSRNKTNGITTHESFEEISGKISKGKLDMGGSDVFERRASYPFRPSYAGVYQKYYFDNDHEGGLSGYNPDFTERTIKKLSELDDNTYFDVYITFNRILTLDEINYLFGQMIESEIRSDTQWWAVCQKDEKNLEFDESPYETSVTMGFCGVTGSDVPAYYYSDAPSQSMWRTSDDPSILEEGIKEFSQNYIEAVRYMADRQDFIKMINKDHSYEHISGYDENAIKNYLNSFADNLEKNGIYVYGCRLGYINGNRLKNLSKISEYISYVYTEVPRD